MKIKLYAVSICDRCKKAREELDKKNIEYEYIELDFSVTPKLLRSYLPILDIDGMKYKGLESYCKIEEMEDGKKDVPSLQETVR